MRAQEGGVVAELCSGRPVCTEDALEIVFESGTSSYEGPLEAGVEIPVEVILDTRSARIQGFSYGVKHDAGFLTLLPESVTTAGTSLDPESADTLLGDPSFVVASSVPGGFISAVVLAFKEAKEMPLGRSAICRAAYRVDHAPSCAVIRFVHQQLATPRSPSVAVNITTNGLSMQPWLLRHGLVGRGACAETCDDLADNDGDGLVDCDDIECAAHPLCTGDEICDDGMDNDADGKVDCKDYPCSKGPSCPQEECSDAIDNDEDGAVDCADVDCINHTPCRPPVEACGDGIDNDGDSLVDCDDADCLSWRSECYGPEVCADGRDNDRDSRTDCEDRDCAGNPACPHLELCSDGGDNDGDGLIDCADDDCSSERPCIEDCADGIDNDGDGFVDGLDRDCTGYNEGVIPGAMPHFARFIRGDADGNGRINVLDAIVLIRRVMGDPQVFDCAEALNTNADEGVDAADVLPVLRWLFLQGPPLPSPFPRCDYSFYGGCTQSSPGC